MLWLKIPLLSSFVTMAAYPTTTAVSSCAASLCTSPYFWEDALQAQTSSQVLTERWWTSCSFCLPSSLLIVPFFKNISAHAAAAFSFLAIPKEKGCTTNPFPLCWLPQVGAAEVLTSNLVWEFDRQTSSDTGGQKPLRNMTVLLIKPVQFQPMSTQTNLC